MALIIVLLLVPVLVVLVLVLPQLLVLVLMVASVLVLTTAAIQNGQRLHKSGAFRRLVAAQGADAARIALDALARRCISTFST